MKNKEQRPTFCRQFSPKPSFARLCGGVGKVKYTHYNIGVYKIEWGAYSKPFQI